MVIGIIGLIAGLLFPALALAKQKAVSTKCLSNLHQLGVAVRLYADSNEGRLPRPGGEGTKVQEGLPQILSGYIGGNSQVFRCPGDKDV